MIEDTPNTFIPAEMQCVMNTTNLVWDWIKKHLTEQELSKPPFHITKRLDQILEKYKTSSQLLADTSPFKLQARPKGRDVGTRLG